MDSNLVLISLIKAANNKNQSTDYTGLLYSMLTISFIVIIFHYMQNNSIRPTLEKQQLPPTKLIPNYFPSDLSPYY